jgi:hypothetical protein
VLDSQTDIFSFLKSVKVLLMDNLFKQKKDYEFIHHLL